jgi:hypothetical protein
MFNSNALGQPEIAQVRHILTSPIGPFVHSRLPRPSHLYMSLTSATDSYSTSRRPHETRGKTGERCQCSDRSSNGRRVRRADVVYNSSKYTHTPTQAQGISDDRAVYLD